MRELHLPELNGLCIVVVAWQMPLFVLVTRWQDSLRLPKMILEMSICSAQFSGASFFVTQFSSSVQLVTNFYDERIIEIIFREEVCKKINVRTGQC